MRRLLLILLVCLLPLQSFAASYARLRMDNMAMATEQGAMPCHEDANSTASDQGGCCKSTASCELVCALSVAIFSGEITPHVPTTSAAHYVGLQAFLASTHPGQPVKPPIL
jgi:hypothetical protein